MIETTTNTSKSLACTGASSLVRAVPPGVKSTLGSSDVREAGLLESDHCHSAHGSRNAPESAIESVSVSCSLQE